MNAVKCKYSHMKKSPIIITSAGAAIAAVIIVTTTDINPPPPDHGAPERIVVTTSNTVENATILDLTNFTVEEKASVGPCLDDFKLNKLLFTKLPANSAFVKGSPTNEVGRYSQVNKIDFEPMSTNKVDSFSIGVFEVTQKQYELVTGEPHGNKFVQPDRAKDYVSWNDAKLFIDTLNKKLTGYEVDLPTDTQWEYACRAGTRTPFCDSSITNYNVRVAPGLEKYASYLNGRDANIVRETVTDFPPVGAFLPNAWNLYDMHGGAWEWCKDDWTVNDTKGMKTVRGGGYWFNADDCRSANRHGYIPTHRNHGFGFRIVIRKK